MCFRMSGKTSLTKYAHYTWYDSHIMLHNTFVLTLWHAYIFWPYRLYISIHRLFKSGGGRVINITDYRKRHNELTFILVDSPEQTHIPLKNPSVPLLRIKYIHNVVLEVCWLRCQICWPDISWLVAPLGPWGKLKTYVFNRDSCWRHPVAYIQGTHCSV